MRTLAYTDALALNGANYPQTPCRLKIGSWAGGASSSPGTVTWAGGATDFADAPFVMYVDSVSITNYNPGSSYTYSDKSGDWQSITVADATNPSNSTGSSSATTASASGSGSASATVSATTLSVDSITSTAVAAAGSVSRSASTMSTSTSAAASAAVSTYNSNAAPPGKDVAGSAPILSLVALFLGAILLF